MRLLVDENISKPATCALRNLIEKTRENAEIQHLLETSPVGILDSEWLPKFQSQSEPWLVLTADMGKRSGGKRLPDICRELGIRHVLISGKLHQKRQFDKMRAILTVWPDLRTAFDSKPGSCFKLQQTNQSFSLKAA